MVTEVVKAENNYQTAFRQVRQSSPTAAWVELVRGRAMDRFEHLGFPSVRNEDWKYTNLAPLVKETMSPAARSENSELLNARVQSHQYPETSNTNVVVVDGFMSAELSSLSGLGKVITLDLFEAIADPHYGKI